MEFLTHELDDPEARPCGVCANCQERGFSAEVQPEIIREAIAFLRGAEIIIEPRKRWPPGLFPELTSVIPEEMRNAEGRALCYYGDAGWGKLVREGKYKLGNFSDELVDAAVVLIRERWRPSPKWITAIPSRRHPTLVYDFASRLAKALGIPFEAALVRTSQASEQKLMANSSMQARNVADSLQTIDPLPTGAVLLVDDIIDSGWTLTLAGWLLRQQGSGVVHPFTLARATARKT
jgi:ATP-dependent DNA helicase RecQ